MPTYAYACTECGHRFDAVQSFSDAALTDCPECHGRLRKLFSAVGIVFKGSGFYRTDSRAQANGSKVPSGSNGSQPRSGENGSSTSKEPAATASAGSTSNSSSSSSAPTSAERKAS